MGFEGLYLGVHGSQILQIPDAMTLPFTISVKEDQDVILRDLGNPGDCSHRKSMKIGGSLSLNWGAAAHLETQRRARTELNTD